MKSIQFHNKNFPCISQTTFHKNDLPELTFVFHIFMISFLIFRTNIFLLIIEKIKKIKVKSKNFKKAIFKSFFCMSATMKLKNLALS